MTRRRPPTADDVADLEARTATAALLVGQARIAAMDAEVVAATAGLVGGSPEHLAALNAVVASWTEREHLAWMHGGLDVLRAPGALDLIAREMGRQDPDA